MSDDIEYTRKALGFIDPNMPRKEWAEIGMALKNEYGDLGFSLFDHWSQGGESYNSRDTQQSFKSFSQQNGGFKLGTIVKLARDNGFSEAAPHVPESILVERKAQVEKAYAEAEKNNADVKNQGLRTMKWRWDNSKEASNEHPYLQKKGIEAPDNIRNYKGYLQIPIHDANGEMISLQSINQDGGKYLLKGLPLKGGSHQIGNIDKDKPIIIAEGYATAYSLHKATGYPAIVAFNANNLEVIAKQIHAKYPDNEKFIAADNDILSKENTGVLAANKAASSIGGKATVMIPEFNQTEMEEHKNKFGTAPTDFNDMDTLRGRQGLQKFIQIAQQRKAAKHVDEVAFQELHISDDFLPSLEDEGLTYGLPPAPSSLSEEKPPEGQQMNFIENGDEEKSKSDALASFSAYFESEKQVVTQHIIKDSDIKEQVALGQDPDTPAERNEKEFSLKHDPSIGQAQAAAENDVKAQLASNDTVKKEPKPSDEITIPDNIKKQYFCSPTNDNFFNKEDSTLAFSISNSRLLKTKSESARDISNMLHIAEKNNWKTIKLSGSENFKKEAWFQAKIKGLNVKGYKPSKDEIKLLDAKLMEQKTHGTPPKELPKNSIENISKTTANIKNKENEGSIILGFGTAPYNNDPNQKKSFYLKTLEKGQEKTTWGVGLNEAIANSGAQIGDKIKLNNLGRKSVTVTQNVLDDNKKIVGTKSIDTHRNEWSLDILEKGQLLKSTVNQQAKLKAIDKVNEHIKGRIPSNLDNRQKSIIENAFKNASVNSINHNYKITAQATTLKKELVKGVSTGKLAEGKPKGNGFDR